MGFNAYIFPSNPLIQLFFFLLRMGVSLFTIGFSMNKTINNQLWVGGLGWWFGIVVPFLNRPLFPKGNLGIPNHQPKSPVNQVFFSWMINITWKFGYALELGSPLETIGFRHKITQIIPLQF